MVSIYFRINRNSFSQNYSLSSVPKIYRTNYLAFILHIDNCEVNFHQSLTSVGEYNTKNVAKDCIKHFEIQEDNFMLLSYTKK